MAILEEKEFNEIAKHSDDICISIFIPTQRAGQEVLENKNMKHLKSMWDQTEKDLRSRDVDPDQIEKMASPVKDLLADRYFWRHQSDGLAVFVADGFFKYLTLPVNFEAYRYISSEFYVKPLVPAMTSNAEFHILSVQLEDVKLYEASRYSIAPIDIEDITPQRLEEQVGFQFKEKTLQFRTQGQGGDQTQFHGHGDSQGDTKKEIKQYFRAVSNGIQDYLQNKNTPLIVYCQDNLYPIYKDANTYNHMLDQNISGNPNDTDLLGMHEKVVNEIEPFLNKKRQEKLNKYEEFKKTESTSSVLTDIIPAIQQGKVDTLFIENRSEEWGKYDAEKMEVKRSEEQTNGTISLLNLAAAKTIEMGGNVYLVESAFMPEKEASVNALFRY